ncbi:type I-MYXAN CRISPR-associated protein Cas6/Cmx6 [Vitiosangium sp. GDMCC 1.1324]|nr:type I-MYXAN CRISPR-associated protein Cas6/Cmx6 [Vitiosangium sp. GDMCC 1.1324]PTL82530.1 type I-MYXAN CRISPR-associated protein Cas6/Cmx6 [Vitiosangium sp. GDMCC 1.1324]
MPTVDLVFPARGGPVPLDHGYLLFSALSARIPELHEHPHVGVFNLRGDGSTGESLHLGHGSLRIRCPAETIPLFLGLAGGRLELVGRSVTIGAPTVRAMEQVPRLSARLVTFKHSLDEQSFRATALRFIEELTGAPCTLEVGRRRIVTIAGKKVVGFGLELSDLSPEASVMLQEKGLGGRRHMGCGLFLPTRADVAEEPRHARPAR